MRSLILSAMLLVSVLLSVVQAGDLDMYFPLNPRTVKFDLITKRSDGTQKTSESVTIYQKPRILDDIEVTPVLNVTAKFTNFYQKTKDAIYIVGSLDELDGSILRGKLIKNDEKELILKEPIKE